MRNLALVLLLGVTLIASASIFLVHKNTEINNLTAQDECVNYINTGLMIAVFKSVMNTCNKELAFTVTFQINNEVQTITTRCLKQTESQLLTSQSDDFYPLASISQPCSA